MEWRGGQWVSLEGVKWNGEGVSESVERGSNWNGEGVSGSVERGGGRQIGMERGSVGQLRGVSNWNGEGVSGSVERGKTPSKRNERKFYGKKND